MGKKFVNLGSMNSKREKDAQGRVAYTFKLAKGVKLVVNGEEVAGEYLQISRPTDKFEKMLAKGTITEEEYEQRLAEFDKGGKLEFVKFEISAVTGKE